jgi:hypothetical protein
MENTMKAKYFLLPFIMLFATMTFSQTNIEEPAGFELIAGPREGSVTSSSIHQNLQVK